MLVSQFAFSRGLLDLLDGKLLGFFSNSLPIAGKLQPLGLCSDIPGSPGESQALLRQFAVLVRVFQEHFLSL
jgi:hypothetical protein